MVRLEAARLAGCLRPAPDRPGFALPILRSPRSNSDLTQIAGNDGCVASFRQIEHPAVEYDDDLMREVAIATQALYAYAFPGEPPFFADRAELADWLSARLDDIDDPMLRLQASEFCGLPDEVREDMRRSYAHLSRIAPKSADAWRDVVILPPRVREAVGGALQRHSIDIPGLDLGRDVTVAVDGGCLVATYGSRLFEALRSHEEVLGEIVEQIGDLRDAFALGDRVISIARDVVEQEVLARPIIEPVVIAIGNRGHSVVKGVKTAVNPLGPPDHTEPDMVSGTSTVTALYRGEVIWKGGDIDAIDNLFSIPLPTVPDRLPVLLVFELAQNARHVLNMALAVARHLGSRYHSLIAVIPHLPDLGLARDLRKYDDTISAISTAFDGICFLSDQSPHMRSGAIGPAISINAARTRLATLIESIRFDGIDFDQFSAPVGPDAARVSVFASVSGAGSRIGMRLFQQAMMRTRHVALDVDSETRADFVLGRDLGIDFSDLEEAIKRLYGFEAYVARASTVSPTSSAVLRLDGVIWHSSPSSNFDEQCRNEFTMHGWRTFESGGDREMADFHAIREGTEWRVDCKAFGDASHRITMMQPRVGYHDRILVTDASVHRDDFVSQCLSGRVPLNFSRIGDVQSILDERYGYILRALHKDPERYRMQFMTGAFDLIMNGLLDDTTRRELPRPDALQGPLQFLENESGFSTTADAAIASLVIATSVDQSRRWRLRTILTDSGWIYDG